MIFEIVNNAILVKINTSIINKAVIDKSVYWLTKFYNIEIDNTKTEYLITFNILDTEYDLEYHRNRIQTVFIDFNLRDRVEKETKTIRELIIAKAFYPIENK